MTCCVRRGKLNEAPRIETQRLDDPELYALACCVIALLAAVFDANFCRSAPVHSLPCWANVAIMAPFLPVAVAASIAPSAPRDGDGEEKEDAEGSQRLLAVSMTHVMELSRFGDRLLFSRSLSDVETVSLSSTHALVLTFRSDGSSRALQCLPCVGYTPTSSGAVRYLCESEAPAFPESIRIPSAGAAMAELLTAQLCSNAACTGHVVDVLASVRACVLCCLLHVCLRMLLVCCCSHCRLHCSTMALECRWMLACIGT